jgi:ubiquitin-protein ligase
MASVSGDWQTVGDHPVSNDVQSWLDSKGLGKVASSIVEATDAETLDDLKLIDAVLVEEVIKEAGLKLVTAKKFREAIAELRGESVEQTSPTGRADVVSIETAPAHVQECIAICIDRSGSMGAPFAEITLNVVKGETKDSVAQRTRMEAVKAMFYAFRDRVESLGSNSHQLGLLQFDNKVEQMLDITSRLDLFETIVDDMQKRGQTAIYSAIVDAATMLEKQFEKDPQTDLRILVLTDGQSNAGVLPQDALQAVNRIGAVVDAIIVGDNPDANLRKIVNATEGECYQISNLGEGFELLEAEGVVSLLARRGGKEKPPFQPRARVNFESLAEKTITSATAVQRAPALAADFATKAVASVASVANSSVTPQSNRASLRRILAELKQISAGDDSVWTNSGEGIHVFPAPDNLNFWRALIEGPAGTPFEGGVFALNVIIPDNYPFCAPKISFETPIYHCNVNDSGKICLDILMDRWNPSLSVPKGLEAIRLMMQEPNTDDSLRQWIAELTLAHKSSNGADTRYYDNAREATKKNANLSVDEWKQKWGC